MGARIGILSLGLLLVVSACAAAGMTIPDAKLLPDNSSVSLSAKTVTYAGADFFYIEEDSRCMGIRVEKSAHGLMVGVRADVSGTMKTNGNNERYLDATSCAPNGSGTIEPLFMNNKALGGQDWQCESVAGIGQQGISGARGLNNIGLLVRLQGRVMQGAPGDTEAMHLEDGSGAHVSVVLPPGVVSPGYGAIVAATGVLSCAKDHQQVTGPTSPTFQDLQRRVVLARDVDLIRPAPAWNYTDEMVYIPAGSFLMGNNGAEPWSPSNEFPQHSVYLSGYWIGKYEVTRGEYQQFMNAGGYSNPAYWSSAGWSWKVSSSRTRPYCWPDLTCFYHGEGECSPATCSYAFTQTSNHPVVGVSYYEAQAFCNWAGGHLPTQAQWEKAARWTGSYPNVYPWGNVWDVEKCNNYYDHNAAGGGYGGHQTAPVGSYASGASPYGCEDMAGNVWEWCRDWFTRYYYSQSPVGGWIDPQGPSSGSSRVLRSGSWGGYYGDSRCAFHSYYARPNRGWDDSFGFRMAR